MAVPSDYTQEQIAAAIELHGGYIPAIAKSLDCKTSAIRPRIQNDPLLRELLHEQQELTSDEAEMHLAQAIRAGRPWAIRYWLSRKGRNRGYGNAIEVQATVDGDSRVVVYLPDDGREAKSNDNGDSTAAGTAGDSPT